MSDQPGSGAAHPAVQALPVDATSGQAPTWNATTGKWEATSIPTVTGTGFSLPTSDPAVAGALWNNAGTVKVSTGS